MVGLIIAVIVTTPPERPAPVLLEITAAERSGVSSVFGSFEAYRSQLGQVADNLAECLEYLGVSFRFRNICR